ncbi:MAG TPA: peptidoglycan binding domain-containing protein, partial [Chloroflexota bacterium]
MRRKRGLSSAVLLGLLLALLLGSAVLYEGDHVGLIYPGVRAGDEDLGNLDQTQAAGRLQQTLSSVASRPLPVLYGDRQWTTSFADLGLHYDVPGTVAAAYAVGRQVNPLLRLGDQFIAPVIAPQVPAAFTLDDAALRTFVASLAAAIDRPTRDAGVQLNGAQLVVTAAQGGQRLDQHDAIAQLQARVAQLSTAPVALKVTVTPPTTGNGDVAGAIAQARRWVSTSLTLETPIGNTVMSQAQIAALIHLTQARGS